MIEYVFSLEDLTRLRFAISPSWELATSLRALREPSRAALHLEWVRSVRGALGGLDLRPALALLARRDYTPDFVTPPPESPLASIEEDLERIRATPAAQVRREVSVVVERSRAPELQAFLQQPRREARRLADALGQYWERALAPSWPRVRALLEADLGRRARRLSETGAGAALGDLHPAVRWSGDRLRVNVALDRICVLDGRGIQLVPSAFQWDGPVAVIGAPWQPTVIYPARGVALLWEAEPPQQDAVATVLGRTRARILVAVAAPATTTQLARRLGISAAGASQHLTALAAAGLVTRRREGREVLYLRSGLADALMSGEPSA
jgi:DNA-binding transcriptional ArsR family regulator